MPLQSFHDSIMPVIMRLMLDDFVNGDLAVSACAVCRRACCAVWRSCV